MAGIIFFKTNDLEMIKEFYTSVLEMSIWLDQGDCCILKNGNLLLGFCTHEEIDTSGMITFFYPSRDEVDAMYTKLQKRALQEPVENEKFKIYQFFAKDPEGRMLEFQCFLHPLDSYLDGKDLLVKRRSIRSFEDTTVPREVLWKIFETCRYSPTSRNSQSYYFVVLDKEKDDEKMEFLASLRGNNSRPIARAPIAVAICSDPEKTGRPEQDGCIAGLYFMLASWLQGLGTCWIAAMDREDVKETIGIPKNHHVVTVTPLGYPKRFPGIPNRREAVEMVKFLNDSKLR
ncbi:MAG: nitroreductase family protein [Candidatus Hodarchaeales archaeon]|jgi:nitroreductase